MHTRPEPDQLASKLQIQRLSNVVDIGANPVDGTPPYQPLLDQRLCNVTGFEPQQQALEELNRNKGDLETYLPWAVGDGQSHRLYECKASGMTSLLEPDPEKLARFNEFSGLGTVVGSSEINTRRLDDIDEIQAIDFLKIDIQGAELMVFENARRKLANAVVIQTEVSFVPLYRNQPLWSDVDRELRSQGFIPHAFAELKRWPIAPFVHDNHPRKALHQLLEADLVYVRDFTDPSGLTDDQLRQMAQIVHHCYGSGDLATHCMTQLIERGSLDSSVLDWYFQAIGDGTPAPAPPSLPEIGISF